MLKLKRALAMLLAIMMMMSGMAFAEEEQVIVTEAPEVHEHEKEEPAEEPVKEEAEKPAAEPKAEPKEEKAAEEPKAEEPAQEPVKEEPAEEIPAEEPEAEEEEAPAEETPAEEATAKEIAEEAAPKAEVCPDGHKWNAEYDTEDKLIYSVCTVCGAENDCEHVLKVLSSEREDINVTAKDENGHSMSYVLAEEVECETCGIEVVRSEKKTVENEAHELDGDTCKWCGQKVSCDHANYTVVESYKINGEFVAEAEDGHRYVYDEEEQRACKDCGDVIKVIVAEDVKGRLESHEFDFDVVFDAKGNPSFTEAVCDVCKYVNTCEHSIRANNPVKDIDYSSAADNGDGTHSYNYIMSAEYECSICGAYKYVDDETIHTETAEPHGFNGDVCEICGAENACKHVNAVMKRHENFYDYEIDDKQTTADTHFFVICYGADYWYCPDCDDDWYVMDDEPNYVDQAAAHIYEEDACMICNQPNVCQHAGLKYDESGYDLATEQAGFIVKRTLTTHTVLAYKYQYGTCPDCGETVYEYEDLPSEVVERHSYKADGSCEICGYVPECDHKNTTVSTCPEYGKPVKVNSKVHKQTMTTIEVTRCVDCGHTTQKTIATEEVFGNHYNWSGKCECGHVFTCEHKNLAEPVVQTVESGAVAAEGGHNVAVTIFEIVKCADCGAQVSKIQTGTETKLYPHQLSEANICIICNYVSECAHSNCTETEEIDSYYEPVDTEHHRKVDYVYTTASCKDCGQELENKSHYQYTYGKNEAHTFANGKCDVCGMYEVVCEHEYTDGVCDHCGAACDHSWTNSVCTICGKTCVDHQFANGACTVCGKPCVHNWTNGSCTVCGQVCEHEYTGGTCSVCQLPCPHAEFVNGNCAACGLACTHTRNTSVENITRDANHKPTCADQHTYDEIAVMKITCNDCGNVDEVDAQGVAPVAKTGVCADADGDKLCDACAGEMGRTHTGTFEFSRTVHEVSAGDVASGAAQPAFVEYVDNGNATHNLRRYLGHNVYACSVCGAEEKRYDGLNNTILDDVTENCAFVNGVCVCGGRQNDCVHEWGEDNICTLCGTALREVEEIIASTETVKIGYKLKQALNVSVKPADATVPLTFATSNKKIATVDKDGIVTGVAAGDAKITVSVKNPSGAKVASVKIPVKITAAPASVALQSNSPTAGYLLCVGESFDLTAKVTKSTSLYELTWTCGSDAVTLAADGDHAVVTGAKAGATATVTVSTQNGKKDTFKFKVVEKPESLSLNATTVPMGVGQTFEIKTSFSPAGSGSYVKYASSDAAVATVSSSGKITATGAGAATITASAFGAEASMKVVVSDAPSKLSFNRTAITAKLSEKTIVLKPVLEQGAYSKFTYSTSNKKVATVVTDEDGNALVTLKKTGTATITAKTYNGKKATCKITVVKNAPTSFSVSPAELTVAKGDSKKISFKFTSGRGSSQIAMRDSAYAAYEPGIVIGKEVTAEPAELTFFYPGDTELEAKNKVLLTVLPELAKIELEPAASKSVLTNDSAVLSVGQTLTLSVKKTDAAGNAMDDAIGSYFLKSSNAKVATVSTTGKITAKAKGTATITALGYNGVMDTFEVEVKSAPSKLSLSKTSVSLGREDDLKETFRIVVTPKTSAGEETVTKITTKTSSSSIATVKEVEGEEGYVYEITAVGKKLGTATITFTSHNGKKATCKVTVKKAPTSIKLNAEELFLGAGQTDTLKATLSSGSASQITWTSSNDNVAKVEGGKITAVAKGTAIITAATFNGLSASCTVNVSNAPASIKISAPDKFMSVGQKMPISVELLDAEGNTAYGTFTVTSNRSSYVSVKTMQLTAKKATTKATDIKVVAYNSTEEQPVEDVLTISEVMAAPTALYFYKGSSKVNSVTIGVGEELKINMKHNKSEDTPVDYSISAKPKATIATAEGFVQPADQLIIKGVGAGSTKVTVKSHNGKTASLTIYVKAAPTAIELGNDVKLCVDETYTIPVKFTPSNAYANVKWDEGANEGIMSFKNGKITALEPGALTITANTYVKGVSDSIHLQVYGKPVELGTEAENDTFEIGVVEFGKIEGLNLNNFIVRYTDDGESHYCGKLTVSGLSDAEKKIATIASDGSFTVKKAGTIKFDVKAYSGATLKNVTIKFSKYVPEP